jgi:hypothetical protein
MVTKVGDETNEGKVKEWLLRNVVCFKLLTTLECVLLSTDWGLQPDIPAS